MIFWPGVSGLRRRGSVSGMVDDASGGRWYWGCGIRGGLIGVNNSMAARKGCGKTKYAPVAPHINRKAKLQNPTALCRSQVIRFHPLRRIPKLRRQFATPGHHTTKPVKHRAAVNAPPIALAVMPGVP